MAITDSDSFDAAIARAVKTGLLKNGFTARSLGAYHSLWKVGGSVSSAFNPPTGAGSVPDRNTAGALFLPTPTGLEKLYLTYLSAVSGNGGTLFLGDRLWANSGLNGTLTTAQAINGGALSRVTSGVGLQMFLEVYTATGTTGATATVSYTNSDGVAGRTSAVALGTSMVVGQFVPFPLQVGDKGLSITNPIQSLTLSVSTGTAGDFGMTIVKPICEMPMAANNLQSAGPYDLPIVELDPNTCLFPYAQCGVASMALINGSYAAGVG